MNPRINAVRTGLRRGGIEFRQVATSPADALGWLWLPIVALIVMYALSGTVVPGTDFSLGTQAVPGILGMNVMITGLMGLAMGLTMDREDGTLLRAKATPKFGTPLGRLDNPCKGLQESALAGAVRADDTKNLTDSDLERNVCESPEVV